MAMLAVIFLVIVRYLLRGAEPCGTHVDSGLRCRKLSLPNGKVCYKREWMPHGTGASREVRFATFFCRDDFQLKGTNTSECTQICSLEKCLWIWTTPPPVCIKHCQTTSTAMALTPYELVTSLSPGVPSNEVGLTTDRAALSDKLLTDTVTANLESSSSEVTDSTIRLTTGEEFTKKDVQAEVVTSFRRSSMVDALIIIACVVVAGFMVLTAVVLLMYRKTKEYRVTRRKSSSYISFDSGEVERGVSPISNADVLRDNGPEIKEPQQNKTPEKYLKEVIRSCDTNGQSEDNRNTSGTLEMSDAHQEKTGKFESFPETDIDDNTLPESCVLDCTLKRDYGTVFENGHFIGRKESALNHGQHQLANGQSKHDQVVTQTERTPWYNRSDRPQTDGHFDVALQHNGSQQSVNRTLAVQMCMNANYEQPCSPVGYPQAFDYRSYAQTYGNAELDGAYDHTDPRYMPDRERTYGWSTRSTAV